MAGVNKAIIVGNLGADPEVRYMESGQCVANINVATSRSYTNKAGEKVDETEWHRIVFWGKLAEIVEKYLKKGNSVYVEGRLQTRKWTDKDGNDRYTTEIVAQEMNMLGGKSESGSAPSVPAAAGSTPQATEDISTPNEPDDLPF